jgi:two-component system alkaline phosphatase synthesis response regulator PhoP
MKGKILLIEDDMAIAMALRDRLQSEGYDVTRVEDGMAGFENSVGSVWDLIILDIMLPGRDGLEICRDIRAKGVDTPVLMLTARDETVDKVVGLKMGADDYLTKPFEMIELLARVEALLRRRSRSAKAAAVHRIGVFEFDIRRGELRREGKPIALTAYELKLLRFLCERRGEILDRDTLLDAVWGYDSAPLTRTVDIHIASLRKKLGDSKRQEHIITVRGLGYKLAE